MTAMTDDRIPLRFASADQAGPEEALLIEEGGAGSVAAPIPRFARPIIRFGSVATAARIGTGHVPGCACCIGRGAAATALGDLFRARALGRVAWFTGVVAVVFDPRATAAELQADRLAAARFRVLP